MIKQLPVTGGRREEEEQGVADERDQARVARPGRDRSRRIPQLPGHVCPGQDSRHPGEEHRKDRLETDRKVRVLAVHVDLGPRVVVEEGEGRGVVVGETRVVTGDQLLGAVHGAVDQGVVEHSGTKGKKEFHA